VNKRIPAAVAALLALGAALGLGAGTASAAGTVLCQMILPDLTR
jgi:hypothetical protein